MKISTLKKNNIYLLISIAALITIWQISSFFIHPVVLPSPAQTLQAAWQLFQDNIFWQSIAISFSRGLSGFLLALIIGFPLGLFMGLSHPVQVLFRPIIMLLQTTPIISWLVLAWIWFGTNGRVAVFIIFIAVVPFIIINVLKGIEQYDPKLTEMADIFQITTQQKIFQIYIPQVFPYLMAGATTGLGTTWKVVAMAELLACRNGIGASISAARINLETADIFVWTSVLVILGYGSERLLNSITKKVMKNWR